MIQPVSWIIGLHGRGLVIEILRHLYTSAFRDESRTVPQSANAPGLDAGRSGACGRGQRHHGTEFRGRSGSGQSIRADLDEAGAGRRRDPVFGGGGGWRGAARRSLTGCGIPRVVRWRKIYINDASLSGYTSHFQLQPRSRGALIFVLNQWIMASFPPPRR